jgi:hypothetical protein
MIKCVECKRKRFSVVVLFWHGLRQIQTKLIVIASPWAEIIIFFSKVMLFKMHLRPRIKSASDQIQLNSIYWVELHVLTYFRSLSCTFPCNDDTILHKNPTNAPTYVNATLLILNNPTCFSPQEAIFWEY